MALQKHLRFLLGLLYGALALAALALLLPGLLPFLLGRAIAFLLEPVVRLLCRTRPGLRRPISLIVLLSFSASLFAGGWLLFRRLWAELAALSARLPDWIRYARELGQMLDDLLYRWTVALSPDLRAPLQHILSRAAEQLSQLISSLGARLLEWCADGLLGLPRGVLFLFTALMSGYFFLADQAVLTSFFRKLPPRQWLPRLEQTGTQLKQALGGWLRAQGLLMASTFLLLSAAFLLLDVETAILLAAVTAAVDALPVFGAGTVLLPWALAVMLGGNLRRGTALLGLYAVLWLIRSILEPKLIANRAGLHPLAALFAMYLGFSLFGVAGMLLAPPAAVLAAQLYAGSAPGFRKK